jgi:L-lactate dehydrogenase
MPMVCNLRSSFENRFKVAIIGCGSVGAAAAYAMLMDGTPTELVLIDRSKERVDGLRLDFEHSLSFLKMTRVSASDDYEACKDADLIFVTAGARQQEGETRLQLVGKNRKIIAEIIPAVAKVAPKSIIVMVSNPVDVLTLEAIRLSGFPQGRVFGTGTMLDTARLRFHIAEKLCLNSSSVQAYVLGEHGDTSFPVFSSANVAGKSLYDFDGFTKEVAKQCYEDTRNAAYRIIHDLGYTCYSIGIVMKEIMVHVFQHSKVVVPLSVELKGYYGHSGVALSVPCVLDSEGVSEVIEVPLDKGEQEYLAKSVQTLKGYLVFP